MRIIINAYQYSPSITGTDRMAYNFLRELQKIDTTNDYYIVCSSEQYIQSIITAGNFKILQPKHFSKHPFARRVVNKIWREGLERRLLPIKADVYFSFHNMRLPRIRVARRMIASNLDLIPLVLDDYKTLSPGQIDEIKKVAENADAFMSISDFSKQELHELLDVDQSKIEVIPLAADGSLSAQSKPSVAVPRTFIFTIGGSEPRKNVMTVAKAFAKLPEETQKKYPLLIVGGAWHGRPLEKLRLSPHIKLIGYADDATLAYLYQHATAFIFASIYEGFGFTILEAMSQGAPVISTLNTSLKEVAGNATLAFDSDSVDGLRQNIETVIHDKKVRTQMINNGYKQSQKFSWEDSARKLHTLLTKGGV